MNKKIANAIALWSRLGVALFALMAFIGVLAALGAINDNSTNGIVGAAVYTRICAILLFAATACQAVFTALSEKISIPSMLNAVPGILVFIMNFLLNPISSLEAMRAASTNEAKAATVALYLIMLSVGYLIRTIIPNEAPLSINAFKTAIAEAQQASAAKRMNAYYNQGYNPNMNGYNPNMNQGYNPNAGYNPNMNQNYNPNMNPNAGYNPNMNQNPGYNPNVNPNTGYNPNMNQNPGYNPNANQNPGYNPNVNQNYNPNMNQNNRMQ